MLQTYCFIEKKGGIKMEGIKLDIIGAVLGVFFILMGNVFPGCLILIILFVANYSKIRNGIAAVVKMWLEFY